MSATPVKALVVRSPWAQQIAAGTKPVEWRCWRTHYRGWLAIVAARRRDSGPDAGRAVCLVRLTDCVEMAPKDYAWHLADPHPLAARVTVPGRLGLFDVTALLSPHLPKPPPAVPPPLPPPLVSPPPALPGGRRPKLREIHQFLGRRPKGWTDDDPSSHLMY